MRENLTKELTIESYAEYPDKMDPVKRKAIEAQLFKSSQVKKHQEKYIKKVMKKYGIDNKQYSYTTREAIALSIVERNGDWMLVKDGQTLNEILSRVAAQKNESSLSNPRDYVIDRSVVEDNDNTELDNEIRSWLYSNTMDYQDYPKKFDGGREWSWVRVRDILDELGIDDLSLDILADDRFLKKLHERIHKHKSNAVNSILGQNLVESIDLYPWQCVVFDEMVGADKEYNLLSLAPRFGKTILILEYCKYLVKNKGYKNLVLVPASKDLSSNYSFVMDYLDKGYSKSKYKFDIVSNISLFKDEDKIIENLKNVVPKDSVVVLVTDEADSKSHTEISVDKINLIRSEFNVIKNIAMSGTGIYKAAKIYKDVDEDDIFFFGMNYTEMSEFDGPVVKRNFMNVHIEMDTLKEDVLNIRQSFADPRVYKNLSNYIHKWVDDEVFDYSYGLRKTNVVMVFAETKLNKHLSNFVKEFEKQYPDLACLVLTSEYTVTNGTAQQITIDKLWEMKQNGDDRKLVVFSKHMATRSYSVEAMGRVVVLKDGFLTNTDIQKYSRCLTYNPDKPVSDIIRIGFEKCEMASEIFMLENEKIDYTPTSNSKVLQFLTNNSFTDVVMKEDGTHEGIPLGNLSDDILDLINKTMKFTDSTNYIYTKLFNLGIEVDTTGKKQPTSTTSMVKLKTKKRKLKVSKKTGKLTAKYERALKEYINIMRSIPSIANIDGVNNFDDFISSGEWENYLNIDKDIFMENYNNSDEFKGQVNSLFRYSEKKTIEEHKQRLQEYMSFIGF